jgi:hypothetical protein
MPAKFAIYIIVGASRFELELNPPKGLVLPLHYAPVKERGARSTYTTAIRQSEILSAEARGFEPLKGFYPLNTLAPCRFRPLSHASTYIFSSAFGGLNQKIVWLRVPGFLLKPVLRLGRRTRSATPPNLLVIIKDFC